MEKETENKTVRCAIYTRKSVEEGLEQEFNSLDAQRLACENYAASQISKRWQVLPDRYDDGGFSGGNTNRPALKRLLEDIKAGKIDLVLFYKIDRLSRSIADFAELLKFFDAHNVNFCSVTQELNTATSAGRMMVNILITFAQYEREVITERVRDKMAASRLRGKWVGGTVPVGYKVVDKKLVVVPEQAETVRWIFSRYLQIQSPKQIAFELNRMEGGSKWTNARVSRILVNYTYIGKVCYHGEVVDGEQDGIIDEEIWDRVQERLRGGPPQTPDSSHRLETTAPLKGILRCGHCGTAMMPMYTVRRNKKYLYYTCHRHARSQAAKSECPVGQLAAGMVEDMVFRNVRAALALPEIVASVVRLTNLTPADVSRELGDGVWKGLGNGVKQRLLASIVKEAVVHADRIEITLNTAGFAPLMQEVWNESAKD